MSEAKETITSKGSAWKEEGHWTKLLKRFTDQRLVSKDWKCIRLVGFSVDGNMVRVSVHLTYSGLITIDSEFKDEFLYDTSKSQLIHEKSFKSTKRKVMCAPFINELVGFIEQQRD